MVHRLHAAGRLQAAVVPRPASAWGCSTSRWRHWKWAAEWPCWGWQALRRLTEARNQHEKPQGPVGPLQVYRVSRRHHPYKLINGIRNQLSHMNTHLCQNGINQLTLRQGEVRVMVTGQNVAEQQSHPYLGKGGHAGAHDPHPFPYNGPGEILPWYA